VPSREGEQKEEVSEELREGPDTWNGHEEEMCEVPLEHSLASYVDDDAGARVLALKVGTYAFSRLIHPFSLALQRPFPQHSLPPERLSLLNPDSAHREDENEIPPINPREVMKRSKGTMRLSLKHARKYVQGRGSQSDAHKNSQLPGNLRLPQNQHDLPELLPRSIARLNKLSSEDVQRPNLRVPALPPREPMSPLQLPNPREPNQSCQLLGRPPTEGILTLEVADSGCGISPEDQQHLFKPFSQANKSIHGKYGGTGLGLWLCDNLIRAMKGTISCISAVGQGTKFVINLPAKSKDRPDAKLVLFLNQTCE
jgi:hypothetical protein